MIDAATTLDANDPPEDIDPSDDDTDPTPEPDTDADIPDVATDEAPE